MVEREAIAEAAGHVLEGEACGKVTPALPRSLGTCRFNARRRLPAFKNSSTGLIYDLDRRSATASGATASVRLAARPRRVRRRPSFP
ncbi:MAG: hypothetical protein ABSA62_04450, partial [Methyloceanibacter sp.]